MIDALVLSKANIDEYITFIDSVVKALVPNPVQKSDIFHLVATYQMHITTYHIQNFAKNLRIKGAAIILESFLLITL